MKTLCFEDVMFLSPMDEESFFTRLGNIKCVSEVLGVGNEIRISIKSPVSKMDLHELLAVSYRYETDMTQLQCLMTKANESWFFGNKDAYWYARVFG